ncbi:MAG: type II 3-dehydroquinate dehydratase [Xanthomonadales bacterium]|nr:type II 3-dehydroquinate dehydratase [Xanthomonadales bacterium]
MHRILVINGPNLDRLGTREPDHYGSETLEQLMARLSEFASTRGAALDHFQSNAEHELIERIHQAGEQQVGFILINPGGFTHTSVALRDALLAAAVPFVEVHISNVHAREEFRRHSYFSDVAAGTISGLGTQGYELALRAALAKLDQS